MYLRFEKSCLLISIDLNNMAIMVGTIGKPVIFSFLILRKILARKINDFSSTMVPPKIYAIIT
jgi:hypothetical protein